MNHRLHGGWQAPQACGGDAAIYCEVGKPVGNGLCSPAPSVGRNTFGGEFGAFANMHGDASELSEMKMIMDKNEKSES